MKINKSARFDGRHMGQFVIWPWDCLVERKQFSYDEAGRAAEDTWEQENAGRFYDSGEGGLEVWALWPDVWTRRACNAEGTLHHFAGECSVSRRDSRAGWDRHGGYPCIAAMLLGSVSVSFTRVGRIERMGDEATYWTATPNDLMPEGTMVVEALKLLYGIEPRITTYLDT